MDAGFASAGTSDAAVRTRHPRIYGFYPALVGDIASWYPHIERVAAMNFDWLLVDATGSGQDGDGAGIRLDAGPRAAGRGLADFAARAGNAGLQVMLDLMAVRPASETGPAAACSEWVDPRHASQRPPDVPEFTDELLDGLSGAVEQALQAGIRGFRCRFAHLVPALAWKSLIARARIADGEVVFLADAVGAPFDELLQLQEADFDLVFNNACWWDFRSDWLLVQLDRLRTLAPSVAFPEGPDGPRLAGQLPSLGSADVEDLYRSRYLFAASVSPGLLMPMGYEFGLDAEPASVDDDPSAPRLEQARQRFDISGFIGDTNRVKSASPALQQNCRLTRLSAPGAPVAVMQRLDAMTDLLATQAATLSVNPNRYPARPIGIDRGLLAAGGAFSAFSTKVSTMHDTDQATFTDDAILPPFSARLSMASRDRAVSQVPGLERSKKRLRDLARQRVIIERVAPVVDDGRFSVKRLAGDRITVSADIFSDGHELVAGVVKLNVPGSRKATEYALVAEGNDLWSVEMPLERTGVHFFTIEAWRDDFASWRSGTLKKRDAGQDVELETEEGRRLVTTSCDSVSGASRKALNKLREELEVAESPGERLGILLDERTRIVMRQHGPRPHACRAGPYPVRVERRLAGIGAWYELMPRSQSGSPDRHGTFDDVIRRLPYVRDLGFDVLYLPPIHPIGRTHRKGRNNSLVATPEDPGSPYAIGAEEGGHTELHPELGSFDDFARLVDAAHANGLELALDFAIQCSPDHPWISEHPEWFDWRPDGTIKYAENPPKKYEDIVNVHFYREALPSIWFELRDVVLFWIDKGVRIFRVDNPHTKPFPFWEWMIDEVQSRHPDALFLSEAFTRPKVMKRLAKLGFTQSYTYFTWRNTKQEIIDYLTELTRGDSRLYMRPNFFTNTPDINPFYLQAGGRAAFQVRLVMAATLVTSYGIYSGFELCEAASVPGKEEYLDSEKYEIRAWDWDRPHNIREDVVLLNRVRRENPALWQFENLVFLNAWNDFVLAWYKISEQRDNCVVVAVNLDPHASQSCSFEIPLWEFGLPDAAAITATELTSGQEFVWQGKVQGITLDPARRPYGLWRLAPPGFAAAGQG